MPNPKHEIQVRHLQALLAATQRERNEAREQLLGLQGHLSRSSSSLGVTDLKLALTVFPTPACHPKCFNRRSLVKSSRNKNTSSS
jgi:hypothetical protein